MIQWFTQWGQRRQESHWPFRTLFMLAFTGIIGIVIILAVALDQPGQKRHELHRLEHGFDIFFRRALDQVQALLY